MSMQAGIWHYDRRPVSRDQVSMFGQQMAFQGPDGIGEYVERGFTMIYRAFHITTEDAMNLQPLRSGYDGALTFDGRLDNRDELIKALGQEQFGGCDDAQIANAALIAWGTKALAKLVGDWALAWWLPAERRLLLACDYIGMRKLYYHSTPDSFYWATDLGALVLHCGEQYTLSDSYFAGYFTSSPDPTLTPYLEIRAVAPGGYVEATSGQVVPRRYWSFNFLREISYRSDSDYEEHFRYLFRQAVLRRLRTSYPILCDLSGGLDSSAIVCMAYDIVKSGEASAVINTLSRFTLEETGGDERPYFTDVEKYIGKSGIHMAAYPDSPNALGPLRAPYFSPFPAYFDGIVDNEQFIAAKTVHQGNRVHLSGHGGDELLGGVQDPVANLAGLLCHLRFPSFLRELESWASRRKTTVWSLLRSSIAYLSPLWIREYLDRDSHSQIPEWVRPELLNGHRSNNNLGRLIGNRERWLFGPPPPDAKYFSLAAAIGSYLTPLSVAEQNAMPYYDRDLVQFLLAVPEEQLLRPAERRSLMRRSLRGLLPESVRTRKTKWIGARKQTLLIQAALSGSVPSPDAGAYLNRYFDTIKLHQGIEKVMQGQEIPIVLLRRYIGTLLLTENLTSRNLLSLMPTKDYGAHVDSRSPNILAASSRTDHRRLDPSHDGEASGGSALKPRAII
jgi:asparagine synthase (glutamine-hydrolysing)